MENREKLNEMWDSVCYSEELRRDFNQIAPKLVELLIRSVLEDSEIEIGTYYGGKDSGSSVAFDIYNTDKKLHLRFNKKSKFELYVKLENYDTYETEELTYSLNEQDTKMIPEGLRNLMKKSRDNDEEMVYLKGALD